MIESQSNEIVFVYHSDKEEDRRMRSFVEAIDGFEVKTFDLKTESLTEQDLEDLAEKLDVDVGALIEPVNSEKLSKDEVIRCLVRDPKLLSTPIIIIGEHAYQFESSSEFIHESATISAIRQNPID